MITTSIQLKDVENLESVFAELKPIPTGFFVVPTWVMPNWLVVLRHIAEQNKG